MNHAVKSSWCSPLGKVARWVDDTFLCSVISLGDEGDMHLLAQIDVDKNLLTVVADAACIGEALAAFESSEEKVDDGDDVGRVVAWDGVSKRVLAAAARGRLELRDSSDILGVFLTAVCALRAAGEGQSSFTGVQTSALC